MIVYRQVLIFSLLALCCAAGCVHNRLSMMVDVKDGGRQIETKNRYALRFNGSSRDSIWYGEWLADLYKSQPKVFDSDGIPVEISGDALLRTKSVANGFTWTGVFAPLLVLPVMVSGNEQKSTYIVDVVDNPDAHATVTVKVKDDTAFCLLSPLPMLCYPGTSSFVDEPSECCKFSKHAVKIMGAEPFLEYGDEIESFGGKLKLPAMVAFCSVDAYGIAVVLKQMEDAGQIDASRCRKQETSLVAMAGFDLVDFHKDDGNGYRYSFVVKSRTGRLSFRESRMLQAELRGIIRNDFATSFPAVNRAVLVVDFVKYSLSKDVVEGTASVLPLDILSFQYDNNTRKGMIRICVEPSKMEEARECCRKNIELIVRDKNIVHVAGQLPPEARYYSLSETMSSDNVLEIEFKAE